MESQWIRVLSQINRGHLQVTYSMTTTVITSLFQSIWSKTSSTNSSFIRILLITWLKRQSISKVSLVTNPIIGIVTRTRAQIQLVVRSRALSRRKNNCKRMKVMPDRRTIKYCHFIITTIMTCFFNIISATVTAANKNNVHPKGDEVSTGRTAKEKKIKQGRGMIDRRTMWFEMSFLRSIQLILYNMNSSMIV